MGHLIRIFTYIFLLSSIHIFSQTVSKVLISGLPGYEQHDSDVRSAFLEGYKKYNNTSFSGTITLYPYSVSESFAYAATNNYQMIVRSTTGLTSAITVANSYPDIQLVMPAGSNSYVLVYSGDIESCPVIITGAGVNGNVTGYKTEFFSIDPITGNNLSSFANGYIAGQIAFLSNHLNISIDSARTVARQNASENGSPDYYNGYGEIDIETTVIAALPVELEEFYAQVDGNSIKLSWQTATEVNNYGFEVQRSVISDSQSEFETIGFIEGHGNSNSPKEYEFIDENPPNKNLEYRLKQIDTDGKYEYYGTTAKVDLQITDVENSSANGSLPIEFVLEQNYPNPFNPVTVISYQLPVNSMVHLQIFDLLGREVVLLVNEHQAPGNYSVNFNADQIPSGMYIYRLQAGNFTQSRKMLLMK